MPEQFFIRRAEKKDASALSKIITTSWKEAYSNILPAKELKASADPEKYNKIFSSLIEDNSNLFYIAQCDTIPCGMIYSCPSRDADLKGCAEIVAIYILSDFWGKGIGQALMSQVIKDNASFYNEASLWVFKENLRARRFYEKSGFSFDGKEKTENFSNLPISMRYRKPICVNAELQVNLPEKTDIVRAFFNADRTRRVLIFRRKDGAFSYTDQALRFDEYEQSYYWLGKDNELSFYDSEESVLRDISYLLEGMTEYCKREV